MNNASTAGESKSLESVDVDTDERKHLASKANKPADEEKLVKTVAAVVTRNQNRHRGTKSPLVVPELEIVDRETFKELQRDNQI